MNSFALKEILSSLLFILLFSIVCHVLFSSLGFVPMDDGIFLAYSRRILDGQIPYKDFLYYANIGTPLLYVPFVYFGGDYTFWITRYFFWFEFASISWIWTYIITRNFLPQKVSIIFRFIVAGFAFFFCAHSFPPMAWYTIDGLFFYSLGLLFCLKEKTYIKVIGYFLVGFTFIIKQNFVFLLPLTIFLLDDWKSIRLWLALLFPSILFYASFLFMGAIGALIIQTTSRTEFIDTAIKGYTSKFTLPWGIIFGFSGIYLLHKVANHKKIIGIFFLIIPVLYSCFYLNRPNKFTYDASFFLLGSIIGLTIFFISREKLSRNTVILILGALTAWSVGISGGYIAPVFASGIMAIYVIHLLNNFFNGNSRLKRIGKPLWIVTFLSLVFLGGYNFYYIRMNNILGELHPAKEMIYKADTILPGVKNIRVSKEVYDTLQDLQTAIKIAHKKHKPYTVLAYATGIWVKSQQRNPLPIDYYFIYHSQKAFVDPLKKAILDGRGKIIVIVNKNNLAEKPDYSKYISVYRFALLVPQYYTKFGETKYHVLYE